MRMGEDLTTISLTVLTTPSDATPWRSAVTQVALTLARLRDPANTLP